MGAWERPALVHRHREPKSVKPTVSVLRGKCTVYENVSLIFGTVVMGFKFVIKIYLARRAPLFFLLRKSKVVVFEEDAFLNGLFNC